MLVAQSCPTLHSPMDYSPWGSSVHGILQARILVSSISGRFFTIWATREALFRGKYVWNTEKAMAPHFSTLAWEIPWMEEPSRLQSTRLLSRTWLSGFAFTFHFHALEKEMATHSSVLAWRILGTGEPGGLPSTGSHRVGHDWSNLAAAAAYMK